MKDGHVIAHHIFQLQDLLGQPSRKNNVLSIIEGWVLLPGNDLLPHKIVTRYILAVCPEPQISPETSTAVLRQSGFMTLWIAMCNTSFLC